jgi:peroxiredoxin
MFAMQREIEQELQMSRFTGLFKLCGALLGLTVAATLLADDQPARNPPAVKPARNAEPESKARRIPDFQLADLQGRQHARQEWSRSKGVVLFFLGTECPVANGYTPVVQELADRYAKQGILVYGVHVDTDVTPQVGAKHATEFGLRFPILLDPERVLAQPIGAATLGEAALLSPRGDLVYRGRIDDRYATNGKRRDEPTRKDLEEAVQATLAGRPPATVETKVFGCPFPRKGTRPKGNSPD